MASFFTKTEARAAAKNALKKGATTTYARVLRESRTAAKESDTFDVFLSHSINDAELIAGVKAILEKMGFSVYVDWADDPQLDRDSVSAETAELLRRRMRQSRALVYVATKNASTSKWMPWELGYFDGFRPGNVGVMPFVDNDGEAFPQQEYLGLYPVVRKDVYTTGEREIFVEDIGRRWTTLSKFAKGQPRWKRYG